MSWNLRVRVAGLLAVCLLLHAVPAGASIFQSDSLLISTDNVIYEYSRSGTLRQTFNAEYPGGYPTPEVARDVVVASNGDAVVYNGTFSPYLSSLAPTTGTWTHRTTSGWDTNNNGTYGGVATFGNYAFATDMGQSGDSNKGVVRFDLTNSTVTRFANNLSSNDLNIGHDKLLYVLTEGSNPGKRIDVYEPTTMQFVRTLDLSSLFSPVVDFRSIAVNAAGEIFIADWNGNVQKLSANGAVLDSISLFGIARSPNLVDIDLSRDGMIAVGDRDGGVTIMNSDFTSISTFGIGFDEAFVGFVPEPSTGMSLVMIFGGVATYRRRRAIH